MPTVTVPLTQGKVAIIDAEDYPLIAQYTWHAASRNSGKKWYAEACFGTHAEHGRWLMHRLLMDAPKGVEVDHIDGDGLNNRRANLRLASHSMNHVNSGPRHQGYKGVDRPVRLRKYRARIHFRGKHYHLGYFDTAEDAARAYDEKARELHGEFAWLNLRD